MKMNILISLTLGVALVGCVKEPHLNGPKSGDTAVQTRIENHIVTNITGQSDAEEVARAGEQLITPTGFIYADRIFDLALQADPSNIRAGFYKNLLKPYMTYKGILARVRPLAVKLNQTKELDKAIADIKDENLRAFLLNGVPDIKDEVGVQNFIIEIRNAFGSIRNFAKNNKDASLVLYFPSYTWSGGTSTTTCTYSNERGNSSVSLIKCDTQYSGSEPVTKPFSIGQAEMEYLQQSGAGFVLSLSLHTSYNVAGIKDLSDSIEHQKLKPPQVLAMVKAMPDFLRLRQDHSMSVLLELGSDLAVAGRWVLANQATLCKPDHQGFCINEEPAKFLEGITKLEAAIRGPFLADLTLETGAPYSTQVDPLAISRKPIRDLKTLLPTSVDNCGSAYGLSDKTMGGMLPNGDAEFLMSRPKPCNQ